MPEYIERDALIDRCIRQQKDAWNKCAAPVSWEAAYEQFETDVSNAPTVDAVEVVRCKDCVFQGTFRCNMTHTSEWKAEDEWFCSYGKRKDGDSNDE